MSRQKELYLLAANFLQASDWRASPQALKALVAFYTKAGAHDSLAAFYDAAAARALEEGPDYGAALQALEEAGRALERSGVPDREARIAGLAARKQGVASFLQARALLESDPAGAVGICQRLLAEAAAGGGGGGEDAGGARVRAGDVLALLVEWCAGQGNAPQAAQLLQQMRARGLDPARFLAPGVLARVAAAEAGQLGAADAGAAGQQARQEQPRHALDGGSDDDGDELWPGSGGAQ